MGTGQLTCTVRGHGAERTVVLPGEFTERLLEGVWVGTDPRCDVVLEGAELFPVVGLYSAGSNHRFFHWLLEPMPWPIPSMRTLEAQYERESLEEFLCFQLGPYAFRYERVDHRPVVIADLTLTFGVT